MDDYVNICKFQIRKYAHIGHEKEIEAVYTNDSYFR